MAITVNDKDLGMVTAYAYALAGGYTGTEAEFEALLGKIAEDLAEIENLSVQVQTLPAGSDATASYAEGVLTLGIPRGNKGETGDQGEIGPTPQLSVGTVTTGEPGTDAEVEITGTPEAPVLNFTIPRGDTGNITQAVRYDAAQTLTDAEKEQARANIDAANAGKVADLKSAVSANAAELHKMQVLTTDSTLTSWTQGKIYYPTGNTASSTGHCRKNAGLIKADTVLLFNGYNLNVFVYTTNAYTSAVYVQEMSTPNNAPIIGADVGYRLDLTPYAGYYLRVVLSLQSGENLAPSDISGIEIDSIAYTDTTLTQSGKSADAKIVGDKIKELTDAVGGEVVDSFTRTGSLNALKTIAFPVTADVPIMFSWTSETGSGELNLYTRATFNGQNLEQLKATARPNTLYKVVPTQDAAYLRVSATASGTITAFDLSGLIGRMNVAENEIAKLNQKAQNVPFVKFKFGDQMYDPSDIFGVSGEIGDINVWSSNALAISKVHAAFDALCASGGAGYGYGERVTGLYKETASDEALFDLTAPSYVTSGVTQGETVTLNIGTDTNGDPVTYNYTYESSTQPYDIRLYKFHDTNNALHSSTTDIPKKKLLLIGGVHGNEFCAPIDLYVFAKHLCTDYTNPDVYKLRSSFDIYIIPYVNGFGCQYQWSNSGTMATGARCNGHLVDINRNCPTLGWVGPTGTAEQITAHFESKIANLALDTFAGPSNGSEFEGQLVKAVIDWLNPDVVIDHHHNSGNSPFYATAYDPDAGYIIYQAANDFACALSHNLPEYYGTGYNINQILGSDVSPATRAAANGHINTMAYECGVKMSAVNEMAQSIAYNNGVYDAETKAATKYSAVVFKVSEYSLLIEMLHLCQYAMEH